MDTERVKVDDVEYHTRPPRYYRCSNCTHEQERKCTVKPRNPTVKLNKKRNHCKQFKIDETKFAANQRKMQPIPIERRPDWYWMTRAAKKRLVELLQSSVVAPTAPQYMPESSIVTPPHSEKLIWTPGDALDDES